MAVSKWKNAWEELEGYIEATDKHLSTQKGKIKEKAVVADMKELMQQIKEKHLGPSPTPKTKSTAAPIIRKPRRSTNRKPRARKRKSNFSKGIDKVMEFLGLE